MRLAMVPAQETAILLLDEPTTFLDIGAQIEVLDCAPICTSAVPGPEIGTPLVVPLKRQWVPVAESLTAL